MPTEMTLLDHVTNVSDFIWGGTWMGAQVLPFPPMVIVLFGTGLFFMVRLGFYPIVKLPAAFAGLFKKSEDGKGEISPFAALSTALSGQIGTGNLAGVATAIKSRRPAVAIYGVEAAMYASLAAELRGEEPKVGGATIAEGIAVKKVGRLTLEILRKLMEQVIVVNEDTLERAVTLFATVEKTVAEGAGAACLAALLEEPQLFRNRKVVLVLTGGNIDTRLLASVLTRSLVREKRITSVRIIGNDQPGLLAKVSTVIGDNGGNIIEVFHNRLALDVPAKGAEFDITIETRDARHTQEIIDALTRAGFPPRTT
jgi:threonine dehydratase